MAKNSKGHRRDFASHLFTSGKPGLVEESAQKKSPETRVPEISAKMRTCWNCGTEYNTAADATACEQWHEAGEP